MGWLAAFHAVWLRDNARGEDARHQDNDQRLFDITELPDDLSLEKARLNEGELEVTYAADGYVTRFPANWLHDNAYDQPRQKKSIITWGQDLKSKLPEADYDAVLRDPVARADWLRQIRDYGFSLLNNVPCEEGKVCEVAEIFGFVRETNYGRLFEVRSEENPVNLAYTGLGLECTYGQSLSRPGTWPAIAALPDFQSSRWGNNPGGRFQGRRMSARGSTCHVPPAQ